MRSTAFDGSFAKKFYKRENLAKIFYASRARAHFVSNFVAHSRKDSLKGAKKSRKNLAKILQKTLAQAAL